MKKTQKKQLRKQIRDCIASSLPSALEQRSTPLTERIEALEAYRKANVVALYWSLAGEVCTHELVHRAAHSKKVVLPVVTGDVMHFAEVAPDLSNLSQGAFGVMEPREGQVCPPEQIDFMLVPGMAFDANGRRLGHGKGYYDRYFELYKGATAGVCFDFQLVDEVPCEEFDKRVDMVISE